MNNITETPKLSLYPDFDYSEIAGSKPAVYFAQVVMNAYMEGVSYLGFWEGTSGNLLILVELDRGKKEDEKVYSFEACPDETQKPQDLAEYFQEYVQLIMLDEAGNYEVPHNEFPI